MSLYGSLRGMSLFTGAGGLDVGLELAGIQPVAMIERDPIALKTLSKNFIGKTIHADLIDLEPHNVDYPAIDVMSGGPPCQGFSYARGKREANDPRNNLVSVYLDWIEEINPKAFILENVAGLLTFDNGHYFRYVIDRLREMGYYLDYKLLHAAQFGIAQNRERVIVVGIHDTDYRGAILPEPTYYIPESMRGTFGKSETSWAHENGSSEFALDFMLEESDVLKRFNTVEDAFFGLPEPTINGEVNVNLSEYNGQNELMGFMSAEGQITKTTNHIAKKCREQDMWMVRQIPEGKWFRSTRFGERNLPIWSFKIPDIEFTPKQVTVLKYIGENLNKDGNVTRYLPAADVIKATEVTVDEINELIVRNWVASEQSNGLVSFRLTAKSGLRARFRRLNRKLISHTIQTVDFDAREKIHYNQDRGISLREGARIQSFPDDFRFMGEFKDVARQIGNAVPPLLGYRIGKALKNILENYK